MEKMHKKLLVLLLAALLIGTVSATVWEFLLKKPATFTIQTNEAALDLYTTSAGPTVATQITWPSILEGAPGGTAINSTTVYMMMKTGTGISRPVTLKFNVVGLPAGCTMEMHVKTDLGWIKFVPDVEQSSVAIPVLGKMAGADTLFDLEYNNIAVGAYSFTINIYAYTP